MPQEGKYLLFEKLFRKHTLPVDGSQGNSEPLNYVPLVTLSLHFEPPFRADFDYHLARTRTRKRESGLAANLMNTKATLRPILQYVLLLLLLLLLSKTASSPLSSSTTRKAPRLTPTLPLEMLITTKICACISYFSISHPQRKPLLVYRQAR